jgi:hypothetical protein
LSSSGAGLCCFGRYDLFLVLDGVSIWHYGLYVVATNNNAGVEMENFETALDKLERQYLMMSGDLTDCRIALLNMEKPYWANESAVSKQAEIKSLVAKMEKLSDKIDNL